MSVACGHAVQESCLCVLPAGVGSLGQDWQQHHLVWAAWTTGRSVLWSGSVMLEVELKHGNDEFLPTVHKMGLVKSLCLFTMIMTCTLFCGSLLW